MLVAFTMVAALAGQTGQAQPPQRARANLNQYFSTDDYPETALARHAEGTVGFRLEIDAGGEVTRCTVTQSSNDPALDAATCAIVLGRVYYLPARDAAGRAVAGTDEGRVTWRLPAPPPMPFTQRRATSVLRSDGAGSMTCTVTINGVPERSVAPERCGSLGETGAFYVLRQSRVPTVATRIVVWGPAIPGMEMPEESELAFGALQYDVVIDVDVGPDGRITGCRTMKRNVPLARPASTIPELCGTIHPEEPPAFEPGPPGAVRHARERVALYVREERSRPTAPAAPRR